MDKSGKLFFNHLQFKMWGNQLSDNSNTTAGIVNDRKKTKFVKRSEQGDYLNRIEMKKNEPINVIIENKGCQTVFSVNEPITLK